MTFAFIAYGDPAPQGSSRGFVIPAKDGRKARAIITSDNPRTKGWRQTVAESAMAARPRGFALMTGPLEVAALFYMPRPKYLQGNEKPFVRRPDLDKLLRSVFDALTGVAWGDDDQVIRVTAEKRYAEAGGGLARAEIIVRSAEL